MSSISWVRKVRNYFEALRERPTKLWRCDIEPPVCETAIAEAFAGVRAPAELPAELMKFWLEGSGGLMCLCEIDLDAEANHDLVHRANLSSRLIFMVDVLSPRQVSKLLRAPPLPLFSRVQGGERLSPVSRYGDVIPFCDFSTGEFVGLERATGMRHWRVVFLEMGGTRGLKKSFVCEFFPEFLEYWELLNYVQATTVAAYIQARGRFGPARET